ncbi:MAG: glycosyltransferase family 39 protein [Bacteroidia bacterium]|nr:glycosyltransferase family 39 protein [Bacteroidia bacterium]
MKNIFSLDGFFLLILLILFTFLLHLPSLHLNYFASDESIYYLIAQKLSQGKLLYLDIWDHKPPMLYWIYWLYYEAFGSSSLLFMRITGCLIILILAIYFNVTLYNHKFISQYSSRASFLVILLLSVPFHIQETNAELWMLSVICMAEFSLWRLVTDEGSNRNSQLFWIGVACGFAITLKYQGIFLYAAILFGYLWASKFSFSEVISFHIGSLIFPVIVVIILHIQGVLPSFWEIGIIYNLDYILDGVYSGSKMGWGDNLFEVLKLFGSFLLLAGIGLLYYRNRIFSFNTKQRKIEILMLSWFIFGLFSVLVGGKRLYPHYLYLIVFPTVFYLMIFHHSKIMPLFKRTGFALSILYPIFTYLLFLVAYSDTLFEKARPFLKKGGWTEHWHDVYSRNSTIEPLKSWLQSRSIQEVWITDQQPELYLQLNQACAVKYVDPVMLKTVFYWASQNPVPIIADKSFTITPEEFFLTFQKEFPTCIIEKDGFFSTIKEKLPLLLSAYQKTYIAGYSVYYLGAAQRPNVATSKIECALN